MSALRLLARPPRLGIDNVAWTRNLTERLPAQRMQLVTINAAALVRVPTPNRRAIHPLTVDQAIAFQRVATTHRLDALFMVALACGLRLGEACGLRWDDVDLETGEVRIRQQLQRVGKRLVLQALKTDKSRRTLVLPDVCLQSLRAHRTRQLEERMKAGADWHDTGLAFTIARRGEGRRLGTGLQPRNVLAARRMDAVLSREGVS